MDFEWPFSFLMNSLEEGDHSMATSSSSAQLAKRNPAGSHLIMPIELVCPLQTLVGLSEPSDQRQIVLSERLEAKSVLLDQSISITSESDLNSLTFVG
jgi:hypothetical protein